MRSAQPSRVATPVRIATPSRAETPVRIATPAREHTPVRIATPVRAQTPLSVAVVAMQDLNAQEVTHFTSQKPEVEDVQTTLPPHSPLPSVTPTNCDPEVDLMEEEGDDVIGGTHSHLVSVLCFAQLLTEFLATYFPLRFFTGCLLFFSFLAQFSVMFLNA